MVPDDIFAALSTGGGGERAMRFLAQAQQSKHQLLLRLVVTTAAQVCHPRAAELASSYQLLADLQADRPSDVEPLLRNPPLGAWAIQAVRDLRSGKVLDHRYLAALAASAALRACLDKVIDVPLSNGWLFLPRLGSAFFTAAEPPEAARVCSSPDGGEIVAGKSRIKIPVNSQLDGDGWRGIRQLVVDSAGVTSSILLDDLDPYRLPHANTTSRLNAAVFGQWQRALDDTWALLRMHHPEIAEEIAVGLTAIVPLRAPQRQLISATSRHSFGTVALSRPPDGRSFAAALAHERQHAKLSALLDLVALIDNPGRARWYAPWRDDPRTLGALLQGAYAHLGVAGFWRRQRHLDQGKAAMRAHAEFARWRHETRTVVTTLRASGALTPVGTRFTDGMVATLDKWCKEPVPIAAVHHARAAAARHRAAWDKLHCQ